MRRMLMIVAGVAVGALLGALVVPAGAQDPPTLYGGVGGRATTSSDLLVLDPASGAALGSRGATGHGLTGLAINPLDGALYGVTVAPSGSDRFLVRIDPATGAATPIGGPVQLPNERSIADLSFGPDGTLYGWTEPQVDSLVTIDLGTGVSSLVGAGNVGADTFGSGLAYDVRNGRLLFAGEGSDGPLRVVDPATGDATQVLSTLQGPSGNDRLGVSALAFGCDGTLYGIFLTEGSSGPNPAQLVTVDPDSGAVTVLGGTQEGLDAIEFACPAPEPEPVVLTPTFTG